MTYTINNNITRSSYACATSIFLIRFSLVYMPDNVRTRNP